MTIYLQTKGPGTENLYCIEMLVAFLWWNDLVAKYVAVLGSYIHNGIFVFKLKRIFKKFAMPPIFFNRRASCSVAHCQSPGV